MKKRIIIIFLRALLWGMLMFLCVACSSGKVNSEEAKTKSIDATGYIEHPDLVEASGLAFSTRNKDVIWSHNDSGNDPVLYSMSTSGKDLGCFQLEGSDSLDWEDMTSFIRNGKSYLMVADTGDNFEFRGYYSLNIVLEPEIKNEGPVKFPKSLKTEKIVRFSYPDGSHDCEASAYDPNSDSFLLISKRAVPPVLYEVPISSNKDETITARKICEVNLKPISSEKEKNVKIPQKALKVTAMDISRDGLSLVLLTYGDAFIYRKKSLKDSWKTALSGPPQRIRLFHPLDKRLVQRESICFYPDRKSILVTTEKKPAGIFRFMIK